jgi:hypothetical protein
MARASQFIIDALRKTATQLSQGKPYEWGHMGNCNCGNLAQTVLNMTKAELHRYAMERPGDWNEQLNDYCPSSGLQIDQVIFSLLEKGFSTDDLQQLERLSNPEVLSKFKPLYGEPVFNKKEHVIAYMQIWADLLEEKLLGNISLEKLSAPAELAYSKV